MSTAMVATAIPFVLQIMNISGWILEIGSNVFRQIGTARDSMLTIAKPLTLVDAPGATPLVVTRGEIAYDRVGFDYWRGDAGTVVRDFSLTVRPGEKIGLVGRSGAGKSTLVNLTLRHVRRRRAARSASTARTSATSPRRACAGRSASSARTPRCCTARCATTSSTAAPAPPTPR